MLYARQKFVLLASIRELIRNELSFLSLISVPKAQDYAVQVRVIGRSFDGLI